MSLRRYVATSRCRSESLVVRFAEILLRFAETSQQTLRQILLLPTTYINFAEKNALKSKLLRHLTHTTIVDSNFMARGCRAKVAAAASSLCRHVPISLRRYSQEPLLQIKNHVAVCKDSKI